MYGFFSHFHGTLSRLLVLEKKPERPLDVNIAKLGSIDPLGITNKSLFKSYSLTYPFLLLFQIYKKLISMDSGNFDALMNLGTIYHIQVSVRWRGGEREIERDVNVC